MTTIKHTPTAGGVDSGDGRVSKNAWNNDHIIYGSADNRPGSPNANDDEFEGDLTGWTTLGSPAVHNVNSTVPGHYYAKTNSNTAGWVGIYKAAPTFPFTVVAKLSDWTSGASYNRSGIILLPSTADKVEALEMGYNNQWYFAGEYFTSLTSAGNTSGLFTSGLFYHPPFYIKVVCTTANQYSVYGSSGGLIWTRFLLNRTPTFTIAKVGLGVNLATGTNDVEAAFDFIRFS